MACSVCIEGLDDGALRPLLLRSQGARLDAGAAARHVMIPNARGGLAMTRQVPGEGQVPADGEER